MIGNDVIDLKLAATQSNWQRKGFLNKVFTESEQNYILNSNNPFQIVWLLWSMKESAYKAYIQQYPQRFFNPKKLVCLLKNNRKGIVRVNAKEYKTNSDLTENFIHTVATFNGNNFLETKCFKIINDNYQTQHKETYNKLRAQVSKVRKVSKNILKIKKNKMGIPKIYKKEVVLDISISLSHHGNYGAFAF